MEVEIEEELVAEQVEEPKEVAERFDVSRVWEADDNEVVTGSLTVQDRKET
jgi:hypothetical protein